jgi:hypothetical protein
VVAFEIFIHDDVDNAADVVVVIVSNIFEIINELFYPPDTISYITRRNLLFLIISLFVFGGMNNKL